MGICIIIEHMIIEIELTGTCRPCRISFKLSHVMSESAYCMPLTLHSRNYPGSNSTPVSGPEGTPIEPRMGKVRYQPESHSDTEDAAGKYAMQCKYA